MTIECNETITEEFVEKHEIKPFKDIIVIKNTVNQRSDELRKINPNIQIRVIGGYDPKMNPKYDSARYHERNTFDAFELAEIIESFEILEEGVDPKWSKLQKSFYLYYSLRNLMNYDNDTLDMFYDPDNDFDYLRNIVSSIRGILRGRALCAGISLIYKELEERQGIKCKFRVMSNNHVWNEIELFDDGEYYPVDLTEDIIRKGQGKNSLCYFLNNPRFYERDNHRANDNNGETVSRVVPTEILRREVVGLLMDASTIASKSEIEEEMKG